MAGANPPYASSRSGKPIQVADQVSIVGAITAVSGTGPSATITVLTDAGNSISVKASDLYAAQTL